MTNQPTSDCRRLDGVLDGNDVLLCLRSWTTKSWGPVSPYRLAKSLHGVRHWDETHSSCWPALLEVSASQYGLTGLAQFRS